MACIWIENESDMAQCIKYYVSPCKFATTNWHSLYSFTDSYYKTFEICVMFGKIKNIRSIYKYVILYVEKHTAKQCKRFDSE